MRIWYLKNIYFSHTTYTFSAVLRLILIELIIPGLSVCVLQEVSANIGEVLKQQKGAENNLKAARQFQGEAGGLLDATREFHRSQKELNRTLEENPMAPDNLAKVQRDRWVPTTV